MHDVVHSSFWSMMMILVIKLMIVDDDMGYTTSAYV